MANRYPFQQENLQHQTTVPVSSQKGNILNSQVTSGWQQQQKILEDQKMREYHKQQQKLKLMGLSTNKVVSADKLIENLLEKKETFQLKSNAAGARTSQLGVLQPVSLSTPVLFAAPIVGPVPSGYVPTHAFGSVPGVGQAEGQVISWLSPGSPSLPPVYRQVWSLVAGPNRLADTPRLFSLLLTSGLTADILGHIWGLANREVPGQLTELELYAVLALVALAQSGCPITSLNILNLISQPPIPNLNVASISASASVASLDISESQSKMKREELNLKFVPDDDITSDKNLKEVLVSEGINDEFSDFQSCSIMSTVSENTFNTAQQRDNCFVPSTSSSNHRIFNSHDALVEKCPNVVVVGSSSVSRGIGSRLANHSLGAPKQNKTRHHKHHHHHHHNRNNQQQVNTVSSIPDDEFSDFQQADSTQSPPVYSDSDVFTKHLSQVSTGSTYMLKESAIRADKKHIANTESPEDIVLKDINIQSNVESQVNSEEEAILEPTLSHSTNSVYKKPLEIFSVAVDKESDKNRNGKTSNTKELMAVEEDRYSALRELSLFNKGTSHEDINCKLEPTDDFGDFVSAQYAEEDPFADICSRDTSSVVKNQINTNEWHSKPQTSEFFVDWNAFQESNRGVSVFSTSNTVSTITSDSDIRNNSNSLEATHEGHITTSLGQVTHLLNETSVLSSLQNLELDSTSCTNKPLNAESLLEVEIADMELKNSSLFSHSYSSSNLDGNFTDLNILARGSQQNDMVPFTNNVTGTKFLYNQEDEEYGDFIGPESSTEEVDGNKNKVLIADNQLITSNKDVTADSQSVSSLEFPVLTLSRHGSLPSLDLKVFSSGSEQPGAYRSWSTSPQGTEHQIHEWCRCVQSCLSLLQAALNLFLSIPSESILEEVLTVNESKDYLHNLVEVYAVCLRVKQAFKALSFESKKLESLLLEAEQAWIGLQLYYSKTDIKVQMEIPSAEIGDTGVCGICLTRLEGSGNTNPLEYGGQLYHAACANLWVNCVDCSLPCLVNSVL